MFARILALLATALTIWALGAAGSDASRGAHVYVVTPGDTLWSIAESHYGGDPRAAVWRIQDRNGLRSALLRPGQKLELP